MRRTHRSWDTTHSETHMKLIVTSGTSHFCAHAYRAGILTRCSTHACAAKWLSSVRKFTCTQMRIFPFLHRGKSTVLSWVSGTASEPQSRTKSRREPTKLTVITSALARSIERFFHEYICSDHTNAYTKHGHVIVCMLQNLTRVHKISTAAFPHPQLTTHTHPTQR